jgi:membrane protein YdbS with pleckstrin-like domain
MHCQKCGREAPAESAFCPACGTRLSSTADGTGADGPSGTQRVVAASRGRGGTPAEEEIWSGAYSAKAMVGSFAAAGVLTLLGAAFAAFGGPPAWAAWVIAAIAVWGGLGLLYLYRRMTVRYRLSTYRFFHDTGLVSRVGNRIEVIDIDDVTVQQGPIERLFGVGTIRISSSDKTNPDLALPGIDDARQVADLIDGARRAERNRRGLHIESI